MMATILPKGVHFQLKVSNSQIGKMKIVRVVTPAWSKLRPSARITKVLEVANTELSKTERKNILRFSVLTPDEFSEVVLGKPPRRKSLAS